MKKKLGPKFSGFDPWTGHRGDPSLLNISGTDENFDTWSSRGSQDRSPLHSDQVSSKSLKPFFRKSWKTIILTTFSNFLNEPDFSRKIRLRQFVATIVRQLHAKFREDPMTGYREKLWTNGRTDGRTNGHGSIYRTNLQSQWVQKIKSLKWKLVLMIKSHLSSKNPWGVRRKDSWRFE